MWGGSILNTLLVWGTGSAASCTCSASSWYAGLGFTKEIRDVIYTTGSPSVKINDTAIWGGGANERYRGIVSKVGREPLRKQAGNSWEQMWWRGQTNGREPVNQSLNLMTKRSLWVPDRVGLLVLQSLPELLGNIPPCWKADTYFLSYWKRGDLKT